MAQKQFHAPGWMKMANNMMAGMVKLGIRPNFTVVLTVAGRKSGQPRSTVVSVFQHEGREYVTSPYGNVDWARNLRAAGTATVQKGRKVERVRARELPPAEAAPILQHALRVAPKYVRSYFDVTADSPLSEIQAEAPRHPVFLLEPAGIPAALAS
ncbi:MAG TPA: nitroreductase family deazaflavin-dependent oxidoreductase [Chloroflexota bacterium]|nr:nitroreductase family deazaflavin-dependent oxidoreductase [Chloroflexota bacterium]